MNQAQALIDAVRAGDVAAADAILASHADAARGLGDGGESPVLEAVYRGHADLAARIARLRDCTIVEAAALGDEARVRALLAKDNGAIAERSSDGWTPLHLAAFLGRRDIVGILIAAGAELEARSSNYMANTALCAAIAGKTDAATISALLEAGADASATTAGGVRPIHLAASRGAEEVVRELIGRGAKADVRTDDGKTAAQFASERGHPAVASMLESIVQESASGGR